MNTTDILTSERFTKGKFTDEEYHGKDEKGESRDNDLHDVMEGIAVSTYISYSVM